MSVVPFIPLENIRKPEILKGYKKIPVGQNGLNTLDRFLFTALFCVNQ